MVVFFPELRGFTLSSVHVSVGERAVCGSCLHNYWCFTLCSTWLKRTDEVVSGSSRASFGESYVLQDIEKAPNSELEHQGRSRVVYEAQRESKQKSVREEGTTARRVYLAA